MLTAKRNKECCHVFIYQCIKHYKTLPCIFSPVKNCRQIQYSKKSFLLGSLNRMFGRAQNI